MNNRLEIDVLNLTEHSSQVLERLLSKKRKHGRLIRHGVTYWLGLGTVSISHDIVTREKLPGCWHYDVLDNESCGEGKSGSVYRVLSVLKHHHEDTAEKLISNRKNQRVYKIQKNAGINEFRFMLRCSNLGARELFRGIPSLISMRQFPGVMLNDALIAERKLKPFTHPERYRITIGLLRALKKQIHGNMICHRDIKPDNIFYDAVSGEINIFDLGISKLIGDTLDKRSRGNSTFSPPEEFISVHTGKPVTLDEFRYSLGMQSCSTDKSDIYSLAEVIRLVWRDVDPIFHMENVDHAALMKRRINNNWVPGFKLFRGLKSMSEDEKEQIKAQLTRMTSYDPQDRPNLDECIRFFDNTYLEYKLTKIPANMHETVKRAHRQGLELLTKLDDIETMHDVCLRLKEFAQSHGFSVEMPVKDFINQLSLKFNYEYNVLSYEVALVCSRAQINTRLSLRKIMEILNSNSSLDILFGVIAAAVIELDDDALSIKEFNETLGINCIKTLKEKDAILQELKAINKDYVVGMERIRQLREEASGAGNHALVARVNYFLGNLNKKHMNIQSIYEASIHIARKYYKLQTDLHDEMSGIALSL